MLTLAHTFSDALNEIDDKYVVEAIQYQRHKTKHIQLKWILIAAALLIGLSITAMAAIHFFGLRDLLLPPQQTYIPNSETVQTNPEQPAPSGTEKVPSGTPPVKQSISLSGYRGSPEWQALAEWHAFVSEYDPDGPIYQSTDGRLDTSFARYSCYLVYSREMANKMDEITAKYKLKLHTTSFDLQEQPELVGLLGNFMESYGGYYTYMYEDGTFQVMGTVDFADIGAWDFQLLRTVRGTFHDSMLDIGDISEYQETLYETACGVPVTLALGKNRVLILADLADSFVTVHIPYGSDNGIKQSHLETLADNISFSALTPVIKPQISEAVKPMERDMDARKIYAATLRNLLYSNILPDGKQAEIPVRTYSQFAVADVDADGKEELVLLYDPGVMANMIGYIIGYDTETKNIYLQLEEFPAFAFLKNGNLKALSSHNQTFGKMWPYALYRYIAESDSYELIGYAHAEDQAVFEANGALERYPEEADISDAGTVYYVGVDTWGMTPIDEADYLVWLEANQGNAEELEIEYLLFTEENILAIEQ